MNVTVPALLTEPAFAETVILTVVFPVPPLVALSVIQDEDLVAVHDCPVEVIVIDL